MNPMKKQWQQWIRMRSKIHGGQAKPVLSAMEDNSSIYHQKMVLPKCPDSQDKGSGPHGGLNTEKQTYFESVVRSHASQLIQLKKQYIESPDERIKITAEKTIERLASSLPDRIRKTVISCPQAYHIIVCLAVLGVKGYPAKLIQNVLEILTMKSYSIPGNKFYPLLKAVSALGPPQLKSTLHDLGPRLMQVMNELTQNEIASIVGLFGENRVLEDSVITKLLALFMASSEMSDFWDLKRLFVGLYEIEYMGDIDNVLLLAERTGKSLNSMFRESLHVPVHDIILLLRAASFYKTAYKPLYITSCRFIEKNLQSVPISQAADAVCAMHSSRFEAMNVVKRIENTLVTNQSALYPVEIVKLWIALLHFRQSMCDSYLLVATLAHKNFNLLSYAELSHCFMLLAEVISKHVQERSLCFFRLQCTMDNFVARFLTRLQTIHKESTPLNVGLNILAALAKLEYLHADAPSVNGMNFSSETLENRVSYIISLFSAIHSTTIKVYLKGIDRSDNGQAHLNAMNALYRHGDRIKFKCVIDYYFSPDGRFVHDDKKQSMSSVFVDMFCALKTMVPGYSM